MDNLQSYYAKEYARFFKANFPNMPCKPVLSLAFKILLSIEGSFAWLDGAMARAVGSHNSDEKPIPIAPELATLSRRRAL